MFYLKKYLSSERESFSTRCPQLDHVAADADKDREWFLKDDNSNQEYNQSQRKNSSKIPWTISFLLFAYVIISAIVRKSPNPVCQSWAPTELCKKSQSCFESK